MYAIIKCVSIGGLFFTLSIMIFSYWTGTTNFLFLQFYGFVPKAIRENEIVGSVAKIKNYKAQKEQMLMPIHKFQI